MDGLDSKQRALAWLATWNPSFTGKAILNKDFTFRSVNEQFCEILGVTPAELLDKKFTDITPEPDKTLDKQNAKLVIDGKSQGYLLKKIYELSDGRRVPVLLLVAGVRKDNGDFDFFVSRIIQDIELSDATPTPKGRTLWEKIVVAITVIAFAVYETIQRLNG